MTARKRPRNSKHGHSEVWMADFRIALPGQRSKRYREVSPVNTKRGAEQYEQQLRQSILDGTYQKQEAAKQNPVPTLKEFFPKFIAQHSVAQKLKSGTVRTNQSIFKNHLLPRFGSKRIDEISTADVARLKLDLNDRTGKTINCVLSVLSKCLKMAVEWEIIEAVPCNIKQVQEHAPDFVFYDFETLEKLIDGARKTGDPRVAAHVVLGSQAGLRDGELQGLEWRDIDLARGEITVKRAIYKGVVGAPKGGKFRRVGMTKRVREVLGALPRGIQNAPVLQRDGGGVTTHTVLRGWIEEAERAAGMPVTGHIHVLRHTFCSHLAMRGVAAIAIKELAGHVSLTTTMRYMHLSPKEKELAIQALDLGTSWAPDGGQAVN